MTWDAERIYMSGMPGDLISTTSNSPLPVLWMYSAQEAKLLSLPTEMLEQIEKWEIEALDYYNKLQHLQQENQELLDGSKTLLAENQRLREELFWLKAQESLPYDWDEDSRQQPHPN